MAEVIKLIHGYNTCSIGTKVLKTIKIDTKNETKRLYSSTAVL